ncbi:MAG TPA: hypothetical protein VF681_08660 [Abditibacteriaceae bacterium]|jgi:type II secretory pathway pseudopilin PulG
MKPFLCAFLVATPILAHAAPAKQQNGFEMYVEASKLIVNATPAVDPVNDVTRETDPKVRAQKYSLARKEAWLKQNAKGFALFQKALTMPTSHPKIRRFDGIFPNYGALRQLARDKAIERNAREMRGDWSGSIQSRLDVVQMGNGVSRGGPIIGFLVGAAIEAIGRTEPWAATEKLNASQARDAAARLQKIYTSRFIHVETLQEEKSYGAALLRESFREPTWRDIGRWNKTASPADRVQALTIAPEEIIRNYTRAMDGHITNARLPYSASKAVVAEPADPFSRSMLGDYYGQIRFLSARSDASNAVWLCALALRAFRVENGTYPTRLDELMSGYLKAVPADPFGGGEKLRYKRTANSYVLWSIGPDGKDDGGKPVPARYRVKPSAWEKPRLPFIEADSNGDYVAGKNR